MTQSTSSTGTKVLPPPSQIQPRSPFSPSFKQCCQCTNFASSPLDKPDSCSCSCSHSFCRTCPDLDSRGVRVLPHSFPVNWICSTCGTTHSVLEILTQTEVECDGCEKPTLQAVYDQFGRIFLYWREDPAVFDLSSADKIREAAWRVWEAGAQRWVEDIEEAKRRGVSGEAEEVVTKSRERQQAAKGKKAMMLLGSGRHNRGWSQTSQSSVSSEDSLDAELVEMGVMSMAH
ncbi:hypothetical protein QBC42DRAFT_264666 [Cladorrhinum samala]|uniref:RING-type domain-containing protein n=1 Tax=Cladorrhinum samala TaxID=585594 RepID=A0AAV9HWR4_9PEZI|nr:hypothetical protein QBC42DRAFT_264666 [Cladorrhinum samala]